MRDSIETNRCDGGGSACDPAMAGGGSGAAERNAPEIEAESGLSPRRLCRTLDYLRSHLAESVSLETLAGLNGLSRSSFFRRFKASTGLSPHQWFLQARIERAKHLLLDGSQSLSDIAVAMGFTDQAHFGQTFKRLTGTPPGAWQRSSSARPAASPPCLGSDPRGSIWT